ncbi:hypothetical protein [Spirosoma panaciterrae]|uniref:hypothetical protein n=1 Tax=Spirosoma panaciterrae TaxID=496058 RepID=UPI001B7FE502|nr:hypothetical protein [Spirosoma panaciterrae]
MAKRALTTDAAFERLLNRPDLWRRTGRPMHQRLNFLQKLKAGKVITLDTKIKILEEAGNQPLQVMLWSELY